MAKVAVIIRQLKDNRPVAMTIIKQPDRLDYDFEFYAIEESKPIINEFKEKFIEFMDADFYVDIVDM